MTISSYRKKNIIYLFNDGKCVFYQAPKGYSNKKIETTSKRLWISYHFNKGNKLFEYFEDIIKHVKDTYSINIKNPYIDYGFNVFFQTNINGIDLEIYNVYKERIHINDLPKKYYIIPYIWISRIVKVGEDWQLILKMTQCMILPISYSFNKCMIEYDTVDIVEKIEPAKEEVSPENETFIAFKDHPIYGHYFKMLKMGIPKNAVRIKIMAELGEDILDNEPTDLIRIKKIPQKQYYEKYFKMIMMGIPTQAVKQRMTIEGIKPEILDEPDKMILDLPKKKVVDLLADIGKKKLAKKIVENIKKEKSPIKKPIMPKMGLAGISLAEILNKKNTILKTNKNN